MFFVSYVQCLPQLARFYSGREALREITSKSWWCKTFGESCFRLSWYSKSCFVFQLQTLILALLARSYVLGVCLCFYANFFNSRFNFLLDSRWLYVALVSSPTSYLCMFWNWCFALLGISLFQENKIRKKVPKLSNFLYFWKLSEILSTVFFYQKSLASRWWLGSPLRKRRRGAKKSTKTKMIFSTMFYFSG